MIRQICQRSMIKSGKLCIINQTNHICSRPPFKRLSIFFDSNFFSTKAYFWKLIKSSKLGQVHRIFLRLSICTYIFDKLNQSKFYFNCNPQKKANKFLFWPNCFVTVITSKLFFLVTVTRPFKGGCMVLIFYSD